MFAYCDEVAAPEWEDPAVNSINRLPARTYTVPLADEFDALTDALEFPSPYSMSLNGEWRFRWVGDPARRPQGFEAPGFDDSGWGTIDVPSYVEMRGYGAPLYTNVAYPHKKSPPKILDYSSGRPDNNPVSSYRRTFTLPESWKGRDTILRFEGYGDEGLGRREGADSFDGGRAAVTIHRQGWQGKGDFRQGVRHYDVTRDRRRGSVAGRRRAAPNVRQGVRG